MERLRRLALFPALLLTFGKLLLSLAAHGHALSPPQSRHRLPHCNFSLLQGHPTRRWLSESQRAAIAKKESARELASILAQARQRLQDPNGEEQWTAALKLAEHDDPAAIPLLMKRAVN